MLDTDLRDTFAFDERLSRLAALIGAVARPGDYCASGRLLAPMPRIAVGDAGVLSFPVPPAQLDALVAMADPAPYGRGEETILDRSVRDCLQIGPRGVDLGGRAWDETLTGIVGQAADGLGCPKGSVEVELYKLLVYEPGGFFAPHRDTEKVDGMVATLVVSLPVAGSGGDLVIRHGGRETLIDMRTEEPSELVWAAFYADCEHETLPVIDGHRVCLVYNLMIRGIGIPLGAPDHTSLAAPVAEELEACLRDPEASGKLIWLLEHDYSAAGLSFATLKNVDAAVGRVILDAAGRAGCALHAAILHVEETAAVEYEGWDREVEDVGDDEYEYVEAIETNCRLEGWVCPDDSAAPWGALPVLEGETMPAGRLDPGRPDSQRLTEASGNEGATLERLYRRAALVLWRNEDAPRVLADAGAASLVSFLSEAWRAAQEGTPGEVAVAELAFRVAEHWPPARRFWGAERDRWLDHATRMLHLLCEIGNRHAVLHFLGGKVAAHYHPRLNGAVVTAAGGIGAAEMGEVLCAIVRSGLARETGGIVDLAERLCARLDDGENPAWRDALRAVVATLCAEMLNLGEHRRDRGLPYVPVSTIEPLPVETLCRFFALAWRFGLTEEADTAAAFFIGRADLVPPDRTVPVLLERLFSEQSEAARNGAAFANLWRHAAKFLLERSVSAPEPPADWRLPTDRLTCGCAHCVELRKFCADPAAAVYRFTVRAGLRTHLGTEIAQAKIDMRCETERHGRPYTLVCIKTRATWERRLEQYGEDIAAMDRLAAAAGAVPGSEAAALALRIAIDESQGLSS